MGQTGSTQDGTIAHAAPAATDVGMMRAWVMEGVGGIENIAMKSNISIPQPGSCQARIRVMAAGLNYADIRRAGDSTASFPAAMGIDGSGVVDSLGPDCEESYPVGTPVYFSCDVEKPYGSLSEFTIVDVDRMFIIQKDVTFTTAAALPSAAWAAFYALRKSLKVAKNKTIFVTAGAGGVGGYAVDLARDAGLTVITTCSSYNTEYAKKQGAHYVLDYTSDDISKEVLSITKGRGVDYVLDTVSSESATANVALLCIGGQICSTNGTVQHSKDFIGKGLSIHYINLCQLLSSPFHKAEVKLMADTVMHLVANGQLKPHVGEVGKWDSVKEGLLTLQSRHVQGKLVINVEPLYIRRKRREQSLEVKPEHVESQTAPSEAESAATLPQQGYRVAPEDLLQKMLAEHPTLAPTPAALATAGQLCQLLQSKDGLAHIQFADSQCWIPSAALSQVASGREEAPSEASTLAHDDDSRPNNSITEPPRHHDAEGNNGAAGLRAQEDELKRKEEQLMLEQQQLAAQEEQFHREQQRHQEVLRQIQLQQQHQHQHQQQEQSMQIPPHQYQAPGPGQPGPLVNSLQQHSQQHYQTYQQPLQMGSQAAQQPYSSIHQQPVPSQPASSSVQKKGKYFVPPAYIKHVEERRLAEQKQSAYQRNR
ncbi:2-haloacrylate reductase [Diplonema papillatum]|nr:2-haloacrylate reductase [Diplonema papillatum]